MLLKGFGLLKTLGGAKCFVGIEDLTGGSSEAYGVIFNTFCERFEKKHCE